MSIRTGAAASLALAIAVGMTAPSCGRSTSCTDEFTLESCGEHCSDIGVCEHRCNEQDCRTEDAVCAEGNGIAECVLPIREACTPRPNGLSRCTADGSRIESCGDSGFWRLYTTCDATSTCVLTPGETSGWCALLPVTDCSQDLDHSECRGLVHVSCAFDAHVLIGETCPHTCVAHTTATSGGYECD
ncbi:MAG: hypothetical protein U0414_15145 [Polyangiaceae bacterium]